jgi:hypothetical protein
LLTPRPLAFPPNLLPRLLLLIMAAFVCCLF